MTDIFRTLIIPSVNVELAREIAASFGPGGENMWQTPLSPTGADPVTYFISSGYIPEQFAYMVPLQVWEQDENGKWAMTASEPGHPAAVWEAATAQGVTCTQEQVDALFAAADVTTQEPFVAMARLGVQIINPPIDI